MKNAVITALALSAAAFAVPATAETAQLGALVSAYVDDAGSLSVSQLAQIKGVLESDDSSNTMARQIAAIVN